MNKTTTQCDCGGLEDVRGAHWGDCATSDSDNTYDGVCPTCHRSDGVLHVGKDHFEICHEHCVRWHVGTNLHSCCRFAIWGVDLDRELTAAEYDAVVAAQAARIAHYAEVEPAYSPKRTSLRNEPLSIECYACGTTAPVMSGVYPPTGWAGVSVAVNVDGWMLAEGNRLWLCPACTVPAFARASQRRGV